MNEQRPKTLNEELRDAHDAWVAFCHAIAIETPAKQIIWFRNALAQWIVDRLESKRGGKH